MLPAEAEDVPELGDLKWLLDRELAADFGDCAEQRHHRGRRRVRAGRPGLDGVRARRQAGSTLKPLLYGLAFDRREIDPGSILADEPLTVPIAAGAFVPANYDGKFHGPVRARVALGSSLNVPAVALAERIGPGDFLETLRRAGFTLPESPEHYGVACKRVDARDASTKSVFNSRRTMPGALRDTIAAVDADVVVVSYNDESWVTLDELRDMCACRGSVVALEFDSRRYVGALIGIHDPAGRRVGTVSHTRNREYVVIAGHAATVRRMATPFQAAIAS